MDIKQKMTFAAVGLGSGAVIIALLVCLFMQIGAMSEARLNRDEAEASLTNYYNSERYPNKANREVREAAARDYTQLADDARALLAHPLTFPQGETPSRFVVRIGETVRKLNARQAAIRKASALPINKSGSADNEAMMDYAFGRYVVQGEMPADDGVTVQRLATQFAAIEHVCTLLLDRGATEILEVSRMVFENQVEAKPAQETARNTRRNRRKKDAEPVATETGSDLNPILAHDGVSRESYTIRFRARYTTLASVLNALACDSLFVVVTDLAIVRPTSIVDRVNELVKKREDSRAAAKRRAENARTEDERRAAEAVIAKPLFEDVPPINRLVTDPAHSIPLDIMLKFDVYAVPPAPASDTEEPASAGADSDKPIAETEGN